jgi:hypothetical protein
MLLDEGHIHDIVKGLESGFGRRVSRLDRLLRRGAPGEGSREETDRKCNTNHSLEHD